MRDELFGDEPPQAVEARKRYQAERLGPDGFHSCDDLKAIEDEAVRDYVKMQESVGLKAVTDGEMAGQREIKAVTYHDVRIRRTKRGWTARVVMDL